MQHTGIRRFGACRSAEVLAAASPKAHKALGRKVRNFAEPTWKAHRERIVTDGSRAKFTQNTELRQALLDTVGTELVEASPFDRIWGIGLGATDPRVEDPAQWRGQNLLGKILTRLRDEFLARDVFARTERPAVLRKSTRSMKR